VPKDVYEQDKKDRPKWEDRNFAFMTSKEGKKRSTLTSQEVIK
jgi:hypothetical protein